MHAARYEISKLSPDASAAGLTLGALDRYLSDMRAWVLASCKTALADVRAQQRVGKLPGALLDALIAAGGRSSGEAARFMRYDARAPHVAIARSLGLSATATGILVMASAPALWGDLAQLYLKIGYSGKAMVDERLLACLLSCDREVVAAELDPTAPLVKTATCRHVGIARHSAPIVVDPQVIRRFAGATRLA